MTEYCYTWQNVFLIISLTAQITRTTNYISQQKPKQDFRMLLQASNKSNTFDFVEGNTKSATRRVFLATGNYAMHNMNTGNTLHQTMIYNVL